MVVSGSLLLLSSVLPSLGAFVSRDTGLQGHTIMAEIPHMVSRCDWVLVEKVAANYGDSAKTSAKLYDTFTRRCFGGRHNVRVLVPQRYMGSSLVHKFLPWRFKSLQISSISM